MFVIDAATLYCQRTRTGQLCALAQPDGSTIKRLIDDWGRTPQPYAGADGAITYPPAYQQVLKNTAISAKAPAKPVTSGPVTVLSAGMIALNI